MNRWISNGNHTSQTILTKSSSYLQKPRNNAFQRASNSRSTKVTQEIHHPFEKRFMTNRRLDFVNTADSVFDYSLWWTDATHVAQELTRQRRQLLVGNFVDGEGYRISACPPRKHPSFFHMSLTQGHEQFHYSLRHVHIGFSEALRMLLHYHYEGCCKTIT